MSKSILKIEVILILLTTVFFSGCQFFINEPDHITIYPQGQMMVVAGDSFTYSPKVESSSGKKCKETPTLTCTGGTIKDNIFYAGDEPGIYTITASYDTLTATTTVKILDKDYMLLPFEYQGKTYEGQTTEGTDKISKKSKTYGKSSPITIEYPSKSNFDCDGFFTLKGTSKNSTYLDYCIVEVFKEGDPSIAKTIRYFLQGDFCERIWLRFGEGTYDVNIYTIDWLNYNSEVEGTTSSNGITYHGAISGWQGSWYASFTVNNTRSEDGRWLYPSYYCQSDNIELMNVAAEKTYGLTTEEEKGKVLNRLVVSRITYDNASCETNCRKRQDAVSTYNYEIGVCEGFANLTAALFRVCGIQIKCIDGKMNSDDEGYHAWNNVSYNDGFSWTLLEPQIVDGYREISYDSVGAYVIGPKVGLTYTDQDGATPRLAEDSGEVKFYLTEQYW